MTPRGTRIAVREPPSRARQPSCAARGLTLLASLILTVSVSGQAVTEILDDASSPAGFLLPQGVAVDAGGNVYAAACASDIVYRITPSGAVTTVIDATGDGEGNGLTCPTGLAVDAAGNVYVAGGLSDNAFVIAPDGTVTQLIDASGDGAGNALDGPQGIAVAGNGNVYVVGRLTRNVFEVTPSGVVTQILDASGDGAGNGVSFPHRVAVDGSHNVYVTDGPTDSAFKITPAGVVTQIIGPNGDGIGNKLESASGIAVDSQDNVFVSGALSDNAFKIRPNGAITEIIDRSGDGAGNTLDAAGVVAVDDADNVYVAGIRSDNVFRITGLFIDEIIGPEGDGTHSFEEPRGLATDAEGNAFVSGEDTGNLFRVDVAECYLVVGAAPGDTLFPGANHLFATQVGPEIEAAFPVLLDDIPDFVLPSPAMAGTLQRPTTGGLGLGGSGATGDVTDLDGVPPWMLDGSFTVQVVMWNPEVFPGQPEQHTAGLLVLVGMDGTVRATPYGTNLGGMELWHEVHIDADGRRVLRFPFSIAGF